jgi:hypothetical protein
MPDLTEAQRERMAEALLTWWLEGLDADDAAYLTSDEGTHLMAEQYASRLAPVVAAIADEAAAEALERAATELDCRTGGGTTPFAAAACIVRKHADRIGAAH